MNPQSEEVFPCNIAKKDDQITVYYELISMQSDNIHRMHRSLAVWVDYQINSNYEYTGEVDPYGNIFVQHRFQQDPVQPPVLIFKLKTEQQP